MAKRQILCPYCFEAFSNTEVLYQCENYEKDNNGNDKCPREISKAFQDYWKDQSERGVRHIFIPKKGLLDAIKGPALNEQKCDKCNRPTRRFVCPHCHNWLPSEMIEKGAEIISVIGGPASGKTNYIVTLIQQIRKYGYKINLQVTPQQVYREGHKDESTYSLYKEKENFLFKEKSVLQKTDEFSKAIPWIFQLKQQATGKTIYLVFYDTAGENFSDPEQIKKNAKYLAHSTGVIVIFDTLSIDKVQQVLEKERGFAEQTATPFDETRTSLNNFATDNKQLYKKPFAFVFSKFDTIIEHRRELNCNIDAFMDGDKIADSSFIKTGKLHLEEIDEISKTIEGCMEDPEAWDKGSMKQEICSGWKDYCKFFGISSFGCMPTDELEIPELKPFRVMDPLAWILHKLGGFDIPTEK